MLNLTVNKWNNYFVSSKKFLSKKNYYHSTFIVDGNFGNSSSLTPRLHRASIDMSDSFDVLWWFLERKRIE
jgi:hypothetical protein